MIFSNVTDEDYGTYVIKVSPFNDEQSQNVTLVLKRSFPSSLPVIVGVCSAAVVVLLLVVVMAVYNKVYILVIWKKIFKKYNKGEKCVDWAVITTISIFFLFCKLGFTSQEEDYPKFKS